jgi:hypothetical protein
LTPAMRVLQFHCHRPSGGSPRQGIGATRFAGPSLNHSWQRINAS